MLDTSAPRRIGNLGDVGPISFGHWRFVGHDLKTATALVETALDLGMNLIDTADVYGFDWGGDGMGAAERLLGEVLASSPGLRDRMVLATKGGIMPGVPYDSSRSYVVEALENSLTRLNTDRVDLYQIHRPDFYTHPEGLARTLESLIESGKVRAVGVSNFAPSQTEALAAYLGESLVSTQPEFSAVHLDPMRDGTMDQAMRLGIRPLAWSPLAGGALATGEGVPDELMKTIDAIAERESADRSAVSLAFVLAHPSQPVAIVGSQRRERLEQAIQATRVTLSRTDVYAIVQASEGIPLP